MKTSLAWLREFVELPKTTAELVDLLTLAGVEVEGVQERGADFPDVVVAQILESAQHPNADRLSVCKVNTGDGETRQIVCGAKNYRVGDKVPLALPGAVLPGNFTIKVGKLRGVESQGMMCSAKELGLGESHEGLLILPADAPLGRPISELFPADVILELEITPNRPDLLSHYGIAREIAALRGVALRAAPFQQMSPILSESRVTIHSPGLCPFYSARRIRGVKVGPSPDWLRGRLEAVGIRSINNIVDVTNYVMMEMGQPLHAFDERLLDEGEIHVRAAAEGESFHALDGKIYVLTPADLVIADCKAAAAIAGVMGGELSGVTDGTEDVLLESALFNPQAVRRTSRRLGLASDSSYRFERGVDSASVLAASDRAAHLIMQVAGGIAAPGIETAGHLPETTRVVALRPERCAALLGVNVPEERIDLILSGFGLRKEANGWSIPSFRQDLLREADLIEEVSRAFGIENIPGRMRSRPAPASAADATHDAQMELRRRLAGMGFYEARTFSLVAESVAAGANGGAGELMRIRNPLIEDQAVLRPSLVPGLIAALERNLRGGGKSIRLFEIGRVFVAGEESVHLGALLTGDAAPGSWCDTAPRKAGLFDIKGCLDVLGIEGLDYVPGANEHFLPAISITMSGKAAGWLGQLTPAAQRALGSADEVAVFEIDLTRCILRAIPSRIAPIPRFPAVMRDIAIIADNAVTHARIVETLRSANEPLLVGVQLFDVFSDPDGIKVLAGKKSLAYSLTYRSAEKTLVADEVNAAHAGLKERLKAALNVSFRE
jgi:phenylalanyl-tRNA synthetase beta chain